MRSHRGLWLSVLPCVLVLVEPSSAASTASRGGDGQVGTTTGAAQNETLPENPVSPPYRGVNLFVNEDDGDGDGPRQDKHLQSSTSSGVGSASSSSSPARNTSFPLETGTDLLPIYTLQLAHNLSVRIEMDRYRSLVQPDARNVNDLKWFIIETMARIMPYPQPVRGRRGNVLPLLRWRSLSLVHDINSDSDRGEVLDRVEVTDEDAIPLALAVTQTDQTAQTAAREREYYEFVLSRDEDTKRDMSWPSILLVLEKGLLPFVQGVFGDFQRETRGQRTRVPALGWLWFRVSSWPYRDDVIYAVGSLEKRPVSDGRYQ